MNAHDAQRDAIAAYALGALDADEAVRAQSHLDDCPDCANEFAESRALIGALGWSAETDALAHAERVARVKRALLGTVRGATTPTPQAASPSAARTMPTVRGTTRKRPPPPNPFVSRLTGLAPLVIVACVIGLALYAFALRAELRRTQSALQDVVKREKKTRTLALRDEEQLTALLAPDARRFDVNGGTVVRRGGRIFYVLNKLGSLPKNRVYQSWTIKPGATVLQPGVTFSPDASGKAFVALAEDAAQVGVVAVSVEPVGGSAQPTSKPLFVRPLS